MKPIKTESPRRAYIRLLSERANLADAAEGEKRDAILYAELIDNGYLRGTAIRDASKGGMTVGAAVTEITLEGRLFFQRLKDEEKAASLVGKFKAGWPLFSGLVGVVVGWLLSSWHPFEKRPNAEGPSVQQRSIGTLPSEITYSTPNPATRSPSGPH